ncbi:MAG: hypothetical protein ACRDMA_07150 [Solirubrobacterales bacterium]
MPRTSTSPLSDLEVLERHAHQVGDHPDRPVLACRERGAQEVTGVWEVVQPSHRAIETKPQRRCVPAPDLDLAVERVGGRHLGGGGPRDLAAQCRVGPIAIQRSKGRVPLAGK